MTTVSHFVGLRFFLDSEYHIVSINLFGILPELILNLLQGPRIASNFELSSKSAEIWKESAEKISKNRPESAEFIVLFRLFTTVR